MIAIRAAGQNRVHMAGWSTSRHCTIGGCLIAVHPFCGPFTNKGFFRKASEEESKDV